MLKTKKQMLKYIKIATVVLLMSAILFSISACKKLAPQQSGMIEETDELKIEGDIMFTISNESGSRSEAAAPIALANAFQEKYKNVKVTVDEANRATYATRISTGEIGDVFWCDSADANNYKKNHNTLMMLDYYKARLGIDETNVFSGALASGKIDGRLYMVPRNFGQQVLIYNADALRQAGISIPSGAEGIEWENFKDICRRLTLEENGAYTQVGACFKIWWAPVWQAFAEGFGGTWVNSTKKEVYFTSDENVMKGLKELVDALNEGWLKSDIIPYSGAKGELYAQCSELDYVFRTFGDMQWITAQGESYDNANIAWDFCPFPIMPAHKVGAGATGYVVYNRTRNPDAAAALALFFLTEEGQIAYHSTSGGNVPLLKSLANEDFWRMPNSKWSDKNFDAFISYPDNNIPASVISRAPSEIATILNEENMRSAFGKIINGQQDVETVFANLEKQCNETWKKLNY